MTGDEVLEESARRCESTVRNRLRVLREDFVTALNGAGADGNALSTLDTPLRVDQIRGIVSSVGGPVYWGVRDGKHYLLNDTPPSRLFLGFVVGTKRYLPASLFVELLADFCLDEPRTYPMEMNAARFTNLIVAEPFHSPERELPIWVTAAHKIQTGDLDDNLFSDIPGLVTDYDILSSEIPPGSDFADDLVPSQDSTPAETIAAYQGRLLSAVLPDTNAAVIAATTDDDLTALFYAHEKALREYVSRHVFSHVASLLS